MAESVVLTNVWAAILAFAVFMYVVMDGFDLGIAGARPAETDIVARARRKDRSVLRHDGDALAQVLRVGFAQIDAVDRNGA